MRLGWSPARGRTHGRAGRSTSPARCGAWRRERPTSTTAASPSGRQHHWLRLVFRAPSGQTFGLKHSSRQYRDRYRLMSEGEADRDLMQQRQDTEHRL